MTTETQANATKRKPAPFTATYDVAAKTVTLTSVNGYNRTMSIDDMAAETQVTATAFGVVNAINNAGSVSADKISGVVDQNERIRRAVAVFDRLADGGNWAGERQGGGKSLGADGALIVRALELSGRTRAEVVGKVLDMDARTKSAIIAKTDSVLAPYIEKAREELLENSGVDVDSVIEMFE